MKIRKRDLLVHINVLTMIPISVICCCEEVFIHINACMKLRDQSPKHGRY